MTILLIILAVIYGGGFFGMGLLIYLLGGSGWRAIPDAIIVGAAWPYVLWDWLK